MILLLISAGFSQNIQYLPKEKVKAIMEGKAGNISAVSIDSAAVFSQLGAILGLNPNDGFKQHRRRVDKKYNTVTYRLKQLHNDVIIDNSEIIVKFGADKQIKCISGEWFNNLDLPSASPKVSTAEAKQSALALVDNNALISRHPNVLAHLKKNEAELAPEPQLKFWKNPGAQNLQLVWMVNLYLVNGGSFKVVVDAHTSEVLERIPLDANCNPSIVVTPWYGPKQIFTYDSANTEILLDNCPGHPYDISTYNLNSGINIANATLYTSTDTNWTLTNEVVGATVHWGASKFDNFLSTTFQRESWDDNNADWVSYANAIVGGDGMNANFSSAGYATFGFGSSTTSAADDWSTIDIIGHEYTHGINQTEGNLSTVGEAGALNESFADIFAESFQDEVFGTTNWLLAEEIGTIRSMANPNQYGDPDTYLGDNWYNGNLNNVAIHTNSGVQNFMYYLLCEGGSGTNDINIPYLVDGLGIDTAREIAYLALIDYMTPNTNYPAARLAWLNAATDLYPGNSDVYQSVEKAWCAVGLGDNCGGLADLDITTATVSNSTPSIGTSITVSYTVDNVGSSPVTLTTDVGFYLIPVADGCPTDIPTGQPISSGSLTVSEMSNNTDDETYTVPISASTPVGQYFLVLAADYEQILSETNSSNNIYCIPITLIAPDLKIPTATATYNIPYPGAPVTFNYTVNNIGTGTIGTSSYVGFYLVPDSLGCPTSLPSSGSMGSNQLTINEMSDNTQDETYSTSIPSSTVPGDYFLVLMTDNTQVIGEESEINNFYCIPITVTAPGLPDLSITTGSVSNNSPSLGYNITVSYTVVNTGAGPVGSNTTVGYYVVPDTGGCPTSIPVGFPNGSGSLTVIEMNDNTNNENYSMSITGYLATGQYYILLVADYESSLSEGNESNNFYCIPITVNAPDIAISAATAVDTTPYPGGAVTIDYTVDNFGPGDLAGTTITGFYLVPASTGCPTSPPGTALTRSYLNGNELTNNTVDKTWIVTIPASTTPGPYYIVLMADTGNYVNEANEINNFYCIPVTVTDNGIPDLIITGGNVSNSYPIAGNSINATYTVYNIGSGPVGTTTYVGNYLVPDSLGCPTAVPTSGFIGTSSVTTSELNDNTDDENESITIPASTSAGTYYLVLVADNGLVLTEESDVNNFYCIPITVVKPDLEITIATVSDTTPAAGDQVMLDYTVVNVGSGAVDATSLVGYYLVPSTNGCPTSPPGTSISSWSLTTSEMSDDIENESTSITISSSTPAGSYFIVLVADYQQVLPEEDENNNIYCIPITVEGLVTLNLSSVPANGGITTGSGSYQSGQTVFISATPESGYIFANWSENGNILSSTQSYALTLTSDRNIQANFTPQQSIITTYSNPSGAGQTSGDGSYLSGLSATVSATANPGWQFSNWTENGTIVSTSANYSFTVAGNRTLFASFIPSTGINEHDAEQSLLIYPNPNNGSFTISVEADNLQDAYVTCMNLIGEKVYESPLNFESGNGVRTALITLPEVASGAYILQVNLENTSIYRKLVIE